MTITKAEILDALDVAKDELDGRTSSLNAYLVYANHTDQRLWEAQLAYNEAKSFWQEYFKFEIENWDDLEWNDADDFATEYAHIDGPNVVTLREDWEVAHEVNSEAHQELSIIQDLYQKAFEAYLEAKESLLAI